MIENLVKWWIKRARRFKKKHPNMFLIILGASIVLFWRGLWGLLDLYLFPNNPALSFSLSILIGLLLLFLDDFKYKELK